MTKKLKPKASIATGYVALWDDGVLGWFMPEFLHPRLTHAEPHRALRTYLSERHRRTFLCEIAIRPLRDSRGRFITRIVQYSPSKEGQWNV